MKSEKKVLGLIYTYYDPAAALIINGKIIAFAEEERFIRSKHAFGKFPLESVKYCLAEAGIEISEIDIIAVGWDAAKFPGHMAEFYLKTWYKYQPCSRYLYDWQIKSLSQYTKEALTSEIHNNIFKGLNENEYPEIRFINHHFAHACSSYLASGFKNAAILTVDGHGEDDCTNFWIAEKGSIRHIRQWLLPNSIGWFYTKFTQWFGFHPHDGEGKLMGLAAYGQKVKELIAKVHKVIHLTGDNDIYCVDARFFYAEFIKDNAFTEEWIKLFGEPRPLESKEPFSDYHKNLAFAVQCVLEEIVLVLSKELLQVTGENRLCVAGGTFMNCKMNGALVKKIGLENFFVQPLAGDNGIALGAAFAVYHQEGIPLDPSFEHLYLGPAFRNEFIESELKRYGLSYQYSENIAEDVANLLAGNKVVGWFQGRMEAGARALGNRSILGNPLNPKMQDLINKKVKFREPWRPFCPSIIIDSEANYFDFTGDLPFMIIATSTKDGLASKLPSVVHVDNSVRVQSVRKEINEKFYSVIDEFKKITGWGVLLNTSFNIKGEPIVCFPEDAIQCFLKTGIDVLAIGDYLVCKE